LAAGELNEADKHADEQSRTDPSRDPLDVVHGASMRPRSPTGLVSSRDVPACV
jgi:hypothetical protein